MRTFQDDDPGYLAWAKAHPNGFVVNANRRPTRSYLKLHEADCKSIIGRPRRGKRWTFDPIKVCAENRAELDRWARGTVGGELSPCGECGPD